MPLSRESKRVLDAMRSGEWLRTQWIARVAEAIGDGPWDPGKGASTRRALRLLERQGRVERRDAQENRAGDIGGVPVEFAIPREEWRLRTL